MKTTRMMLLMLIAGLAIGSVGSTLYWSGQMDRQFKAQAEWKTLVDKQSAVMKDQGSAIRLQDAALRKLTAATDEFFEARRLPR